MSPLAHSRYLKMNGLGNAIVVLDRRGGLSEVTAEEARAIAGAPGIGFDQLMAVHDASGPEAAARLLISNADGSLAEACGNGTRCVAWALLEDPLMGGTHGDRLALESTAGLLDVVRVAERSFTVDMGAPRLAWDEIPLAERFGDTRAIELQVGPIDAPILHSPSCVNMGNPHAIFWVDDPDAYDLARIGPLLENHPVFPERANISLAAILSPDHIRLKVWERGAGLTLACGSAACATLVAAARKRLTERRATVTLPGGDLLIAWRESDGHVLMTGPVELEHEGILSPDLFAARAA